ncbi:hypothetical protein ACQJBY_037679 [Aegilops geniculata]
MLCSPTPSLFACSIQSGAGAAAARDLQFLLSMDVLLLGALPMLLLARTGPGLAAQGAWSVPCGAAFVAAAVVVSRVSRQPMGSGRSETGGPCSPTHRRFSEGEGGAERGWEQQV